jgi:outer membrane protein, heavy metal efflux system
MRKTGAKKSRRHVLAAIGIVIISLSAGCAFHPHGESAERDRAMKAYAKTTPAALAPDASLEEILRYAYLTNAGLEARYWEWRAAIEQIPQDASMPTVPAISLESMFMDGSTSLSQTTLGLQNDPMTNIPWPGKVTAAGRRALELARAAGSRFDAAKLALRTNLLSSYYDYALLAESIRLEEANTSLLRGAADNADARIRAGAGSSLEALKARNDVDLALNNLEGSRSKVPGQLAALNAILGREPTAPLDPPKALPVARELPYSDAEILAFLADRNPELAALSHEAKAGEETVSLMRRQYIPDLGLTLSGDLAGTAKSIMAMLTAPFVRFDAIRASIAQARAELEASRSMRTQMERDLKASAILALYDLRNADREIALYEQSIIPRMDETVQITGTSYSNGRAGLMDILESRRMLVEARLMYAEMRIEREKLVVEIEELSAGAR